MKVLFDNNLSFRLARALSALLSDQHEIVALKDKFSPCITDIELFAALARDGHWIVISGDYRITRNKAERQAFIEARLTGFFSYRSCHATRQGIAPATAPAVHPGGYCARRRSSKRP